jgi:peptidoglycan-associated lipoprotein
MMTQRLHLCGVVVMVLALAGACAKKQPPVARVTPPPPPPSTADSKPPAPPTPVAEPRPVPPEPVAEDPIASRDIGDINKNSPFQPVFFALDSSDVDGTAQQALNANAEIMKKYPSWIVTIEGHADERGTAEYNLALGERRALSARTYLVSLGLAADRLRTVSYGKEFPFDPGHDEAAWAKNRRAQFVLTSK